MHILPDLFLTFARIGLFTFGGGYAMIPLIEDICVEKKGWITHEEMMDAAVIAESTPGPIAINCATVVGYRKGGPAGALAATVGVALPSFCILLLISRYMDHFLEITWVASAFRGIRIAVGLLILDAALKIIRKMPKKPFPLAVLISAALIMLLADAFALRLSSIALMLAAGMVSLSLFLLKRHRGKGDGQA